MAELDKVPGLIPRKGSLSQGNTVRLQHAAILTIIIKLVNSNANSMIDGNVLILKALLLITN